MKKQTSNNVKLLRYKQMIKKFEALLKDKDANASELADLSKKLESQRKVLQEVDINLVNAEIEKLEKERKIIKETADDKEFLKLMKENQNKINNFKAIINEKKRYEKNSKLISAAIAGNYSYIQRRKFIRRTGLVSTIVASALIIGVGIFQFRKTTDKNGYTSGYSVTAPETDDREPENTDDNNKDNNNLPKDEDNDKDNSNDKDEVKDNKDTSKDVAKNDDTESSKKKTTNDNSGSGSGSGSGSSSESGSGSSGGSGSSSTTDESSVTTDNSTTTIVPEDINDIIPEVEDGELPIEPSTEVDNSNMPTITPGTTEELTPSDNTLPPVNDKNITDTGNDSEETHDIDDDSKDAEPEGKKPDKKSDSHTEEKSETEKPSVDDKNITDTGSDSEVTHEVDDDSKDAEPEGEKPERKQDTEEREEVETEVPDVTDDNIVDTGSDSEIIVEENCEDKETIEVNTETSVTTTQASTETKTTEYNVIETTEDFYVVETGEGTENTINNDQSSNGFNTEDYTIGESANIDYDTTVNTGEITYIDYNNNVNNDEVVYVETETEMPELTDDNIVETEDIGVNYTHGALTLAPTN